MVEIEILAVLSKELSFIVHQERRVHWNNLYLGLTLKAENSISYKCSTHLRAEKTVSAQQGGFLISKLHYGVQGRILSRFLHANP
jgi:hypothetical protein